MELYMSALDNCRALHRKMKTFVFVRTLASTLLVSFSICGALILILRHLRHEDGLILPLILASFMISVYFAVRTAMRSPFRISDTVAWIDKELSFNGLLMSSLEAEGLSEWDGRLGSHKIPRISFRAPRILLQIISALVFLVLCGTVPIPEEDDAANRKLDIEKHCTEMIAKIEILEESGVIEQDRKDSLAEAIDNLKSSSSAMNPAKTYEGIDNVSASIAAIADQAVRKMEEAAKTGEELEWAAGQLADAPNEELEKALRKAAQDLSSLLEANPALKGICEKGGCSPQEMLNAVLKKTPPTDKAMLEKLCKSMKSAKSGMGSCMKKMSVSKCSKNAENSLKKFFEDNPACKTSSQSCPGGKPGSGGVSRGRADAPLIFGEETQKLADKLPPEQIEALGTQIDFNETIGVSFAEPEEGAIDDGVSGALNTNVGKGGESKKYPVSPSNRKILKRYFDQD